MKYNRKVEDRMKKEQSRIWVGALTSHDFDHIKHLMQEMYDLGHADGYANAVYEYNEREELNGNI